MKRHGSGLALAVLGGMVFAVGAGASAAATEVTDIRLGIHPGKVRVVLEASSKLTVSSFVLERPYRVVLDMPKVRWRLPRGAEKRAKGFVSGYRFGEFAPGRARIVLDLKRPAVIGNKFTIPPRDGRPWRIVLDLKKATAAEVVAYAERQKDGAQQRTGRRTGGQQPKKAPLRKKVVVIDPGHGGIDPGTTGRTKRILEKNIVLAMARQLKRELDRGGRFKAVLTRDRDVFVRLRARIARARAAGADLFISLHADSLPDRSVNGASVYTLSEKASDREAAALAAKENKADLIAGMDLSHKSKQVTDILIDLAQRETMNHSVRFARFLVEEIRKSTDLLRKTHRFAGFAVLKAPDVPSVLLEMGYLSNPRDEARLTRPRFRARLAKAIAKAIDRYFTARALTAER